MSDEVVPGPCKPYRINSFGISCSQCISSIQPTGLGPWSEATAQRMADEHNKRHHPVCSCDGFDGEDPKCAVHNEEWKKARRA